MELKPFQDFLIQEYVDFINKYQRDVVEFGDATEVMQNFCKSDYLLSKEEFDILVSVMEYFEEEGNNSDIVEYLNDFILDHTTVEGDDIIGDLKIKHLPDHLHNFNRARTIMHMSKNKALYINEYDELDSIREYFTEINIDYQKAGVINNFIAKHMPEDL